MIVGGESGRGARPMQPDWVRDFSDSAEAAGVPFFFKQWGGRSPKQLGRTLDGREWNDMPPNVINGRAPQCAVALNKNPS